MNEQEEQLAAKAQENADKAKIDALYGQMNHVQLGKVLSFTQGMLAAEEPVRNPVRETA